LTARAFDVEEAWDEWDRQKWEDPPEAFDKLFKKIKANLWYFIFLPRGAKATPSHVVNGQRLYQVGISTVHPKDGMPVRVRQRSQVLVQSVWTLTWLLLILTRKDDLR
jgi:hypothetical protein